MLLCPASLLHAQSPLPPSVPEQPVDTPALPTPAPTTEELQQQLEQLRREVRESTLLESEIQNLQGDVTKLREGQSSTLAPGAPAQPQARSQANGIPEHHHSGAFSPDVPERPNADNFPVVRTRYSYNYDGTGPMGGGGYFSVATADDRFTVKLTNLFTVDATFYSKNELPTNQQGFAIPFTRTYLYGNITKKFAYQVDTQASLGTFNLLDIFIAWHVFKHLTLRAGKALTPPMYEYYGFKPPLEPVIVPSPAAQLAAKRALGLMMTGTLLDNRIQWWSGATNSGASLYGNLDNNVDYNGAVTLTPFRGDAWRQSLWEGLGLGLGFSVGKQRYLLEQSGIPFTNNAEATTNANYVTVAGLPFYNYNANVRTDGLRYRAAPHLFWFGRFSLLAEYIFHRRELTDGTNGGKSTQHAYYVNASFWLTGERDYKGTGFQGYATIVPKRPMGVGQGRSGWGAWQIAAQWSQFFAGTLDIRRGLVDRETSTSQMDNLMVGLNFWPNKYIRCSADYVRTWFNHAVPLKADSRLSMYQTAWMRIAAFF